MKAVVLKAAFALGLAGALFAASAIEPPKEPTVNEAPDSDRAVLDKLPKPTEPADFQQAIRDLQQGGLDERIAVLKRKALQDLVPFEAGDFMMGDFGKLWLPSGLYYYFFKNDKPVHKVVLSGFAISKYKVTFAEYDVFSRATKRPLVASSEEDERLYRYPSVPIMVSWKDAQAYCTWLGQQIGRKMSLPTEAQWEYSARSGGRFFAFATDDGNIEYGRNIPFPVYRSYLLPEGKPHFFNYSAALYPPNPSGLYQMHINGMEWVVDWYGENYYAVSPLKDPTGPKQGEFKVVRGQPGIGAGDIGFTFYRYFSPPNADKAKKLPKNFDEKGQTYVLSYQQNFRCAAN